MCSLLGICPFHGEFSNISIILSFLISVGLFSVFGPMLDHLRASTHAFILAVALGMTLVLLT